jgi:hypothetical protein
VHAFHGAGHTPWMSHKEEYLSVINEFLDQEEHSQETILRAPSEATIVAPLLA